MAHVVSKSGVRAVLTSLCLVALLVLTACSGSRRAAGDACCPPEPVRCSDTPTPPPSERPPEAKPGEAWCQVWVPPVKKIVLETYCVCAQRCEKVLIPAQYACRPKLVCISPPSVREVEQPGVWSTETRDVLLCGERETWKRICCEKADLARGEVQGDCWTKTVTPAVWTEECVSVCVSESRRCVQFTPAQHEIVQERYKIRDARCETRVIPAKFATRTREVCVTPGKWIWRHNPDCEVPEELLAALEVEMVDSDASGKEAGVFAVGSTVRYDLTVRSDEGGEVFPVLKVVFSLPEQMEFISGGGDGITVTGSAQSAVSSAFQLPADGTVKVFLLARVLAAPATGFVQASASIQNKAGVELSRETESTTLSAGIEK